MTTVGLSLDPLDVLFFRDGRPFGAASRVTSGLPTPQVLAGAVRTALCERHGIPFRDALTSWVGRLRFRGPWLSRVSDSVPLDVLLPVPATIHTGKKGMGDAVHLLKVLPEGLLPWKPYRPLWLKGQDNTEPATGFIDSPGLTEFLNGQKPTKGSLRKVDDLYGFDHRTGIVVSPDQFTTEEGEIYGISFLALKKGIGFYAEVVVPEGQDKSVFDGIGLLAFGGEGKRVGVRVMPQPFEFPKSSAGGSHQKKMVLLTTPCLDHEGGIPKKLQGKIAAAAVNSPVAISGWDMAKGGPKPTQFAAPAGSVYFLNTNDPPPNLTDELGYGCTLTGVWNDG